MAVSGQKSGRTHHHGPEDEHDDPVIWPLSRQQTLVVVPVLLVVALASVGMLWSFGQQIIHVNELAAMRRCWANQYSINEALARLQKDTGVTTQGLEFNVDMMMSLVEARFLDEPVRDPEPDRRGLDGSWKYYRLRKDGRVECVHHGREPASGRWNLEKYLPTEPPPLVDTPPRKAMPQVVLEKYPLEPGDLDHASYLQTCAEEI